MRLVTSTFRWSTCQSTLVYCRQFCGLPIQCLLWHTRDVPHSTGQPRHDAQAKTERWLINAMGMIRLVVCIMIVPALLDRLFSAGYRYPAGVLGSFTLWVIWSALLVGVGLRGSGRGWWTAADIGIISVLQVAVAFSVPGGYSSWANWAFAPAGSSAVLAVTYLKSRFAIAATIFIICGYLASATYEIRKVGSEHDATAAVSAIVAIILIALLSALSVRTLHSLARQVDQAFAVTVAATERESALQGRFDERSRQYRLLHDTVLHTLSKIARGGLDHREVEVRKLCERDAEYLRNLITGSDQSVPSSLVSGLGDLVRTRAALGLNTHAQLHGLPSALPARVTDAIVDASRESLNNVSKHAGVEEAWLTAIGQSSGGVKVVIVDRGVGFDVSQATTSGVGIMRSIRHRMEEINGIARVDSVPGEGTVVELTWTP